MHVVIVGRGKLATELLAGLPAEAPSTTVSAWPALKGPSPPSVVVHAGSGREWTQVLRFCESTRTPLIELATGEVPAAPAPACPVVLCPNTNLLMLRVMRMLAQAGPLFRDCTVSIAESHQAGKTTAPGTAHEIAASLGVPASNVLSVRDPAAQRSEFGILEEHLDRHAVHRIAIHDGACSVTLETRVLGAAPYVRGVHRIAHAVVTQVLPIGVHRVDDLLARGWL